MSAGKEHGIRPGRTSTIRRIEGGMLSYHADADINTNPFELGLDRLVNLDSDLNFIGKEALKKMALKIVSQLPNGMSTLFLDLCYKFTKIVYENNFVNARLILQPIKEFRKCLWFPKCRYDYRPFHRD